MGSDLARNGASKVTCSGLDLFGFWGFILVYCIIDIGS